MPVSFIAEMLGHGDMTTTAHYLKTLPDENLKQLSESLLSF
jgi:site-specific recombinase XerD